jgi:hypothetical protein
MRKRGVAILSALIGGVMLTSTGGMAAPAQVVNPAAAFFGNPNLNLGSLLMAGFGQDQSTAGIHVEFLQGGNWDASRDLFPAAASLNSFSLSANTIHSAAVFSLAPGFSLGVSHVAAGLSAIDDSQTASFSQQLALRLDPSLRSAGTTAAFLNWNITDWSQFGITASHSTGNPSLIGNFSIPLATGSSPESSALGISARVGFAEGWVTTLAYSEGVSQLDLSQMAAANAVRSDAYGIGLARTGLFGNDALGIAVSRPLQIYSANSAGIIANNFALTTSQARESDVELGYVTSFLDGTLALQANAAYQVNAAGARGQNGLAAVARAKLSF